jgi:hypothetical protein
MIDVFMSYKHSGKRYGNIFMKSVNTSKGREYLSILPEHE